jgi:hypothetical protein
MRFLLEIRSGFLAEDDALQFGRLIGGKACQV